MWRGSFLIEAPAVHGDRAGPWSAQRTLRTDRRAGHSRVSLQLAPAVRTTLEAMRVPFADPDRSLTTDALVADVSAGFPVATSFLCIRFRIDRHLARRRRWTRRPVAAVAFEPGQCGAPRADVSAHCPHRPHRRRDGFRAELVGPSRRGFIELPTRRGLDDRSNRCRRPCSHAP